MAYESLRIACSPLTGNIYAGRVAKAGNQWSGDKKDVTEDVQASIVERVLGLKGGSEVVTFPAGQFRISVERVTPAQEPKP